LRRFFSDDSFWNTPIAADAETDPRSDHCVELLCSEPTGGLHINLRQYTIPVYEVDESTPLRTVHQRVRLDREGRPVTRGGAGRTLSQGPGFGPEIPIPDHAVPDPARDAHAAFVDWERRLAWDVFAARVREDGDWESYTGMHYSLDDDGVWDVSDFPVVDGESIHFHGPSRAAGVPAIAGLILREEVLAGEIRHKLAFATRFSARREFCPPAAWTDGALEGGVPEGALLQLDPDLDLAPFDLALGPLAVARALQHYGMVNVDWAGATTLYGEGQYWEGAPGWAGILGEGALREIPVDRFRVIRMEGIVEMGDSRELDIYRR
jgi:hypothetical protein